MSTIPISILISGAEREHALRSLDTNVLARWLLRDDDAQVALARAVLAEPSRVSLTVMLELGWVLGRSVGLARPVVSEMLQQIVDLETVSLEHRSLIVWAIERYRRGADWGDVLHLVSNVGSADAFVTFDRSLVRDAGADTPLPIETLGA